MDYSYNQSYTTTSYGAQGGGGGGGFIPGGSQENTGGQKYGNDALRPLTIKQINDAEQPHPDGDFIVDGQPLAQITFVGQIRNISTQAINHTYKLDDGTGILEVKEWIDPDNENDRSASLKENAYVRVHGKLKVFNNKRHVVALAIRPIDDYNEIQFHLLESTAVHLHFTKGPVDAANEQQAQTNGDANGAVNGVPSGITGSAKKVYQLIKDSPQTNEGLHMQDIAAQLRLNSAEVQKAGDELINKGLIYSTLDEETWAILTDY